MTLTIRDLLVSGIISDSDLIEIRRIDDYLPYYTGLAIDASTTDRFKPIKEFVPCQDRWEVIV